MNETPSNLPVLPLYVDGAVYPGASLRDLFAGMFLAARIANPGDLQRMSDADAARVAYRRADAMLKAREET